MEDILKYRPVIDDVLINTRARKQDFEDLIQECYLVLIENQEKLEKAGETSPNLAFTICQRHVWKILSKEKFGVDNFYNIKHNPPTTRFDSLTDPQTYRRAAKVSANNVNADQEVLKHEMEGAITTLPEKEQQVLQLLRIKGWTQEQTARELGVSRDTVVRRSKKGLELLKKEMGAD